MKSPNQQNTQIDSRRIDTWLSQFRLYRSSIDRYSIDNWINQFRARDKDLAARTLDVVEFYSMERINSLYQQCLRSISGWNDDHSKLTGRWRFVAYSTGSAGESGDSMLYQFRRANNLESKKYKEWFIPLSQIIGQKLGPEDTIVFVDDFCGSGDQVCDAWGKTTSMLVTGVGRCYLCVTASTRQARERINSETELVVISGHELNDSDNFFSNECQHFTGSEKDRLRNYCKKANSKEPAGHGNCGLMVVFQHNCPNNSLPIFHVSNRSWRGLFPRHN
ncbi:MAG: hypothetical protein PHY34_05345 [Patescibacteria group bacterium]|nr:hypothetical protein [Patescibacteria group bacterium]MDD5716031.1 hypothetical protein [Patescibacteria group bacterium]